jgi:hypothetical protein
MVTIEDVAAAMKLSDRSWRQIKVGTGQSKHPVPVGIHYPASTEARGAADARPGSSIENCRQRRTPVSRIKSDISPVRECHKRTFQQLFDLLVGAGRAGSAPTGGFAAYALSAAAAYPGTLLYVQRNALGTGFNDAVHRNATGHPGWKRAAMVPGTPLRSSLPRRLNKHAARRGASGGSRDDQHDAQSRGRVGT